MLAWWFKKSASGAHFVSFGGVWRKYGRKAQLFSPFDSLRFPKYQLFTPSQTAHRIANAIYSPSAWYGCTVPTFSQPN